MRPICPRHGRAPALGKQPEEVIERSFRLGAVTLDCRYALYRAGLRIDLITNQCGWLKATVLWTASVAGDVRERMVQTRAGLQFAPWALDMRHVSFHAPASGHLVYIASEGDLFASASEFALDQSRVSAVQVD